MKNHELPRHLCEWASEAVQKYRDACLWPEHPNTPETVVRSHLLNSLVAKGFKTRIEVAKDTLDRPPENFDFRGNRGGVDIVFGCEQKIVGLIEVKRVFPRQSELESRVQSDVCRLKEILNSDHTIARYVVVIIGASWEKCRKIKIMRGLEIYCKYFGEAIVARECQTIIDRRQPDDSWTTVVIDAAKCF